MIKRKNNWKYKIVLPGFNYRLSDVSCALGISQIKRLNKFIIERKKFLIFIKKIYQK